MVNKQTKNLIKEEILKVLHNECTSICRRATMFDEIICIGYQEPTIEIFKEYSKFIEYLKKYE